MASFFDPCIDRVLEGLREPIEDLLLDVNVGSFVIREMIFLSYRTHTESRSCRWICGVSLCIFKN